MHYINLIRCLKFTRESQSKYKRAHRVHWLPDSRDEWKIKKLGRTESFIKPFARNMNSQCNCIVSRELFKHEICQLFFFGYGLFWAFTWNGRDSTYKSRIMNPNHKLPWYRGFFFCSLLLCVLFNRMKNCAEHLTFCWIVVVMFEFWISQKFLKMKRSKWITFLHEKKIFITTRG